jgi:hypothetical protein
MLDASKGKSAAEKMTKAVFCPDRQSAMTIVTPTNL